MKTKIWIMNTQSPASYFEGATPEISKEDILAQVAKVPSDNKVLSIQQVYVDTDYVMAVLFCHGPMGLNRIMKMIEDRDPIVKVLETIPFGD